MSLYNDVQANTNTQTFTDSQFTNPDTLESTFNPLYSLPDPHLASDQYISNFEAMGYTEFFEDLRRG